MIFQADDRIFLKMISLSKVLLIILIVGSPETLEIETPVGYPELIYCLTNSF